MPNPSYTRGRATTRRYPPPARDGQGDLIPQREVRAGRLGRWSLLHEASEWFLLHGRREGCYAVYVEGHLAYVGRSFNVRGRLAQHEFRPNFTGDRTITPWGSFEKVSVKIRYARRYGESLMLEARLIRRLAPTFNRRQA